MGRQLRIALGLVELINGYVPDDGDTCLIMPYPFHGCDMTVVEDESESIHVFGDPNAAGGFTLTLDRGWI